jgi:hypothetical protein
VTVLPGSDQVEISVDHAQGGIFAADAVRLRRLEPTLPSLEVLRLDDNPLGNRAHEIFLAPFRGGGGAGPLEVSFTPNQAPVLAAIGPQAFSDQPVILDASDPDGDPVFFSAASDDPRVDVQVQGETLILDSAQGFVGAARITVTARDGPRFLGDSRGRSDRASFEVLFESNAIQGLRFLDTDRDARLDPREAFLDGAAVFLDANTSGVRDPGEPLTYTDANGAYSFTALAGPTAASEPAVLVAPAPAVPNGGVFDEVEELSFTILGLRITQVTETTRSATLTFTLGNVTGSIELAHADTGDNHTVEDLVGDLNRLIDASPLGGRLIAGFRKDPDGERLVFSTEAAGPAASLTVSAALTTRTTVTVLPGGTPSESTSTVEGALGFSGSQTVQGRGSDPVDLQVVAVPPPGLATTLPAGVPVQVVTFTSTGQIEQDLDFGNAPLLPGDGNGDGGVDIADFTVWADSFGRTVVPFTEGDFNGDGGVDIADFTVWADNFGSTTATAPAAAPISQIGDGLAAAEPAVAPESTLTAVAAAPVAVGGGSGVLPSVPVEAGVDLGALAPVERQARIGSGASPGERVRVGRGAKPGPFSPIGPGAVLGRGAEQGERVRLGRGVRVESRAKVPDGSFVPVGGSSGLFGGHLLGADAHETLGPALGTGTRVAPAAATVAGRLPRPDAAALEYVVRVLAAEPRPGDDDEDDAGAWSVKEIALGLDAGL